MDFKEYFKKYNAQKKIDKLAKKYKNRHIVIYAGDEFSENVFKFCDLSKLNIIAVADKNIEGYNSVQTDELGDYACDLILIANYEYQKAQTFLDDHILYRKKNEGIEIRPLIRLSFCDLFLKGK